MICFFLLNLQVCNFADDTTFYACEKDLNHRINRLENDSFLAIEWFENNSMKLNDDKCHLLISGHKYENVWAQIGNAKIWESKTQKLLGVKIDRTLNCDEHVRSLFQKAGRKLSVLFRLSSYMNVKQKRTLMKSFLESQFGFCPLVCMFYSRGVNIKLITCMSEHSKLFIKITVLLNNYLKRMVRNLYIIKTSNH